MKILNSLFLLILMALGCCVAKAQSGANELFVAYGYAPQGTGVEPEVILNGAGVSSSDISSSSDYLAPFEAKNGTSAFTVGYLRSLSDKFALGLTYSYFKSKYDIWVFNMAGHEASNSNHAIMLTGKYDWLKKNKFSLYSRAGIGVRFCSKNDYAKPESTDILSWKYQNVKAGKKLAYQVSAIGMEYKIIDKLSVFVEGGIGNSGCVLCGLKTHF